MTKQRIFFIIAITAMVLLSACSAKTDSKTELTTNLTLSSSFAGTRTVAMKLPDLSAEEETALDKVVQKYCPDTMTYTKDTASGAVYTFSLAFTSAHDYTQKVSDIIGRSVKVAFANPNTVMTHGWKLEEDFESRELFGWIADGAEREEFDLSALSLTETATSAALNGDTVQTSPTISINRLNGYPIQKIRIDTVNEKDVYDRTVTFTISQTTFDELSTVLSDYFKEITDSAGSAEWLLENNAYLYTVKFDDVTLKELEGYTNHLLKSVYGNADYTDKSVGSTALAEQNTFTETLDFSNYVSNSNTNVPVEYTYTVNGTAELSECMLYQDGEWIPATNLMDTNQYGKLSAIKSTDSLLRVRINDGKQYNCSEINVTCTPLHDRRLEKSVTFRYDIATGGNEACHYTVSYFEGLDIPVQQSVEGGQNLCTITFSGTADEVNLAFAKVFGSSNQLKYKDYVPFMTLRTMKEYSDHLDLSALTVGKNIDTAITYSVVAADNHAIKSLNDRSPDDSGTASIRLESAEADIAFRASAPNVSDIAAFAVGSGILILASLTAIFLLRRRTTAIFMESGSSSPELPNQHQTSLAKRKKEKP